MDALFLVRIGVPEGYDGPVIDATALMAAALDIINGGEDDVPVQSVGCERIDRAPLKEAQTDGFMLERVRELFAECTEPAESEYATGWRDALMAALGEQDR